MPNLSAPARAATAFAGGLLAAAFLWPRTRLTAWTAYAPGPPFTNPHLGEPHWVNTIGLTTTYPLALLAGLVVTGALLLLTGSRGAARPRR